MGAPKAIGQQAKNCIQKNTHKHLSIIRAFSSSFNNCYIQILFTIKQRADAIRKQAVIALILIAAIVAGVSTGLASYYLGYQTGYTNGATDAYNSINLEANAVQFNSSELQAFEIIKNRLYLYNTDPAFTGDRNLQWISMRNSTSHDYYQKSMEYL